MVLVLVDDMGFADLGVTGSEINTPNIDKLANNGALLTAMYNCARCCPTRASLLTGLYPHNDWASKSGVLDWEVALPKLLEAWKLDSVDG